MRRLGVAHALLHSLNLILDVAVGDENILPAIIVVIEKETSKSQRNQAGTPHLRLRGFIDEKSVAFVVIQRDHLIGEVTDQQAGMAAAIVIGRIDTHSRARNPVLAEPDARRDATLLKRSIFLIQVKLVGLRVIRDCQVRPTILVVVEDRDAQALRSGVAQSGLLRCVFKFSTAQVVP